MVRHCLTSDKPYIHSRIRCEASRGLPWQFQICSVFWGRRGFARTPITLPAIIKTCCSSVFQDIGFRLTHSNDAWEKLIVVPKRIHARYGELSERA